MSEGKIVSYSERPAGCQVVEVSDKEMFDLMAGHVRTVAGHLIEKFYGKRCPDFEPGCLACEHWRRLDELLANPFDD